MVDRDTSYFRYRAEVEIERAQEATVAEVVRVHCQLAEAYLERLSVPEGALVGATRSGQDN